LKVDDWVYLPEGIVGKLLHIDYMRDGDYHLIEVYDGTFNTVRHKNCLTLVSKEVSNILNAVNNHKEK
jgi:hypothetical protein